jgi:hypothetical protein
MNLEKFWIGERMAYIEGRLEGLAGTTRWVLPDQLRAEIREVAALVAQERKDWERIAPK